MGHLLHTLAFDAAQTRSSSTENPTLGTCYLPPCTRPTRQHHTRRRHRMLWQSVPCYPTPGAMQSFMPPHALPQPRIMPPSQAPWRQLAAPALSGARQHHTTRHTAAHQAEPHTRMWAAGRPVPGHRCAQRLGFHRADLGRGQAESTARPMSDLTMPLLIPASCQLSPRHTPAGSPSGRPTLVGRQVLFHTTTAPVAHVGTNTCGFSSTPGFLH